MMVHIVESLFGVFCPVWSELPKDPSKLSDFSVTRLPSLAKNPSFWSMDI